MTTPRRGEIWLTNFNPARGSEQKGIRPALVIQNDIGNEASPTTIVAAISSVIRVYPINVKIEPKESGLRKVSVVKLNQLRTVDRDRLSRRLGRLSPAKMEEVNTALKVSLDIP